MNKKQLKALLASASQTDFKPEIEGILCKIQGDKVTLVATNAFILNIVTIDNEPIMIDNNRGNIEIKSLIMPASK